MKNICKILLVCMLGFSLQSCGSTETNTENVLGDSQEELQMESSNEGGGNASGEFQNDSFR